LRCVLPPLDTPDASVAEIAMSIRMKGARRASICSSMSGDIGVDAVDPAQRVREQELGDGRRDAH
jgi:hypothetical protein